MPGSGARATAARPTAHSAFTNDEASDPPVTADPASAPSRRPARAAVRGLVLRRRQSGSSASHGPRSLVNTVYALSARGVGLKVLTGRGAAIDTTTAAGELVFGIFGALAEFEREPISQRMVAGLASARTRGRVGVRITSGGS
jgi:DNA invertase Pin-like site-specific DNA recombinase